MAGILQLLLAIVALGKVVASIFQRSRDKKEAQKEVAGELAVKEVRVANAVSEVMAERRDDSDASKRMRDGTF